MGCFLLFVFVGRKWKIWELGWVLFGWGWSLVGVGWWLRWYFLVNVWGFCSCVWLVFGLVVWFIELGWFSVGVWLLLGWKWCLRLEELWREGEVVYFILFVRVGCFFGKCCGWCGVVGWVWVKCGFCVFFFVGVVCLIGVCYVVLCWMCVWVLFVELGVWVGRVWG